jgi:hypothetical protein
MLPLRAELGVKSGGHVEGSSPTFGPGSPLTAMVTAFLLLYQIPCLEYV